MSKDVWKTRSWRDLKGLSDNQLIEMQDRTSERTDIGLDYYLEELKYRRQTRVAAEVEKFTRWIFGLTLIVTRAWKVWGTSSISIT